MTNLKKDIVDELHKRARKNFPRRHVIIKGFDELWQIDLVEMIPYEGENDHYKYLLMVIDCFSKYAFAAPIKDKKASSTTVAMENIFKKSKRIPKNIQSDFGREFYNVKFGNMLKKYNIHHYSSYTHLKSSIVERLNRSIKELMFKMFSMQGNYRWIDKIQDIIAFYNNRVHRTIKMKPIDVKKEHERQLLKTVYSYKNNLTTRTKFKLGDHVRVSKYKGVFEKGYTPNWGTEIFKIVKINRRIPEVYYLEDYKGEEIKGAFYLHELLKVKHPDGYLVEKIIRRNGNKVLVKYLGFDDSHNSWIEADAVV